MKSLSRRHTYRSLFISLILHSLLFFLCVYVSLHMPQELPEELGSPTPARVSMQFRPQVAGTPATGAGGSNVKPAQAIPLPAQPAQAIPLPAQPAKRSAKQLQKVIPTTVQPVSSERPTEGLGQTEEPGQTEGSLSNPGMGTGRGRERSGSGSSAGSSRITGAAFMQAFQNSVHGYRQESAESKPRNPNIPEHVQERIDEWDQFAHRQKVHRALVKATRIYSAYVHTSVPIHTQIPFSLVTDENGTLLTKIEGPFTGHEEIDSFLKEFLTKAEYPPIPKRFNKKEFQFSVVIELTLSEGSHRLQLRAFRE